MYRLHMRTLRRLAIAIPLLLAVPVTASASPSGEQSDVEAFAAFLHDRHEWVTEAQPLLREFLATPPGANRVQLRLDVERALDATIDFLEAHEPRACYEPWHRISLAEVNAVVELIVATVDAPDTTTALGQKAVAWSNAITSGAYSALLLCARSDRA